jgi:hypothetical protein
MGTTACLRDCEKIRGSIQWPRCARVLRAATVRERMAVAWVQPLAYARGSLRNAYWAGCERGDCGGRGVRVGIAAGGV